MPKDFPADSWFPWWKKPLLMSEWEQLETQALIFARSTTETHAKAKETDMPFWFIEKVARNKYCARCRYWRIKRRVERMKNQAMLNLLHVLQKIEGERFLCQRGDGMTDTNE